MRERRAKPINGWAAFGALALGVQLYVLTMWIATGQAKSTPTGADPIPTYTKVAIVAMEIGLPILGVLIVWQWLIKPWRREGHLTLDGTLLIGWVSL